MPAVIEVVIVDDDEAYRELLVLAARACHGGAVREFADGGRALTALDAAPHATLWLVDLHMPGMAGLEFIARLRALRPQAVVAAISAAASAAERQACLEAGAIAVLPKPVGYDAVVEGVRQALRLAGQRLAPP